MNTNQFRFLPEPKKKQEEKKKFSPANGIKNAVTGNLSSLRLSAMHPNSIKYRATMLMSLNKRKQKKREWGIVTESRPRRGREVVQSVAFESRVYRNSSFESLQEKKWNWE